MLGLNEMGYILHTPQTPHTPGTADLPDPTDLSSLDLPSDLNFDPESVINGVGSEELNVSPGHGPPGDLNGDFN